MTLRWLRCSTFALALSVVGWATGCATAPRPTVDPGFAARAYTPARIAVLPPDVFVVLDQVGDNDPAQSAALGQQVSANTLRAIEQALRRRGYDVDLSARWDGITAQDGSLLVSREDLGALANGILLFANSPDGAGPGALATPRLVAPELAARVGWATQSDALLYVNVKGAVTTSGKRAASIVAGVLIVFVIIAVILALASQKNGGGGSAPGLPGGGAHGQPIGRATPSGGGWRGAAPAGGGGAAAAGGGGAWRGAPPVGGGGAAPAGGGGAWRGAPPVGGGGTAAAGGGGAWRGVPGSAAGSAAPAPGAPGGWRGSGTPGPVPRGAPVYRGGGGGFGFGLGVGVVIPLDGPVYTHDGSVGYDDPLFAGDDVYVSMTLVSTYDGRILWHARDHLDLDADEAPDVDRMVHTFLDTLPAARPPAR